MKKQIKNIIYISIIFSFLFVSSATTVFASYTQTASQQNISNNAKAKAALSWSVQGAKAVSKCAIGFAAKAAISGLTNLVLSLLKIGPEVSVKDQSAQNAEALANCVASVAVGLAKDQIVKITKSTFNWINTGLGGDPLYVSNMSNLLNRIENTVISSELSVFRDSQYAEMYPYGRDFASAQIQTQRSMSDHLYGLQSSLFDSLTIDDQALNAADKLASYSHNFAQGGWNGWLSLTQNPQNNPLGFNMLATDQLAYQKEVAVTAKKEEVTAGGGIQDKKECVQYGVTTKKAEATTAANKTWGSFDAKDEAYDDLNIATNNLNVAKTKLASDQKDYAGIPSQPNFWTPETTAALADKISVDKTNVKTAQAAYDTASSNVNKSAEAFKYTHNDKTGEECTKYETVTPGSVIKDQLSKVITSPVVQLELVHTLEDALGSVLDNLMGKLQDNGIKRIDELFNTEKSTVPSMALNSSGELIMGETGSGSRNTGAFDLKDLGNTYVEVGEESGTGTWKGISGSGSGTWTNGTGTGGAGTGTWGSATVGGTWSSGDNTNKYGTFTGSNGSGTWTATIGIGGTGVANWTGTKNGNFKLETEGTLAGTFTDVGTGNGNYILDKKGVIQIQIDYIVAAEQNITLFNNIMPALGELDYCIPGPNPNWEQNSGDIYMDQQSWTQNATNTRNSKYILSLYDTYKTSINSTYGPTSPMLNNSTSGFCVNGATNPPACTMGARRNKDPNLTITCPNYTKLIKSACAITITDGKAPDTYKKGDYICLPNYCLGTGITAPTYACKPGSTLTPTPIITTNTNLDDTPTCDVKTCTNEATNPPACTYNANNSACITVATNPPLCTTKVSSLEYLSMASAGQSLTAGMVQTDVNVTDAKTKYFTNISDTREALKELKDIAVKYNKIITDAQARRNALLSTSTGVQATSVGPQCTFPDELIN